jgi:hypothetical protein
MRNLLVALLLAMGVGLFGIRRADASPVFISPSFEAGLSTGGWDPVTATNTPGWTANHDGSGFFPALNRNQSCAGPYGNNNDACQFVTLGAIEEAGSGLTTWIEQTLSGFTVGNSYMLSWLQSSEYTDTGIVMASIIGAGTQSQNFSSVPYPGGSQFWFTWQPETYTFIADATALTFRFQDGSGGASHEPGIDKIGLADVGGQVPEPASLFLLGSGLLTLVARRRRQECRRPVPSTSS